jgi:hypothetical protein
MPAKKYVNKPDNQLKWLSRSKHHSFNIPAAFRIIDGHDK